MASAAALMPIRDCPDPGPPALQSSAPRRAAASPARPSVTGSASSLARASPSSARTRPAARTEIDRQRAAAAAAHQQSAL
jgi:hypothetical protein